jgi:hypothetical protein
MKFLILIVFTVSLLFFVGSFKPVKSDIEPVSEAEFEEILGHNAAVKQFGDESMLIDTKKFRVVTRTTDEPIFQVENEQGYVVEESDYAKGYHRALEEIEKKSLWRLRCPY